MYNQEFKMKYLEERTSNNLNIATNLSITFNNSESLEKKLNKDISCFTVDEIINFYKSLCSASAITLNAINGQLRIYTHYCMEKNLVPDYQNHFEEIDINILSSCINIGLTSQSIVPLKDLLHMSRNLLNISDKVLVLAAFEGINGIHSIELKNMHSYDIVGNTIKLCSGRELTISDELKESIIESTEVYMYTSYRLNDKHGKEIHFDNSDTTAIKYFPQSSGGSNVEENIRKMMYNKMARISKFLNDSPAMTISNLRESGRIEMIKKLIDNGMTVKEALLDEELIRIYGKVQWTTPYIAKYGQYIGIVESE